MYHMFLGKSLINIAARVCTCVCVHVWEGKSSTSLIALYVNLNEAVALVRIHITNCLVCELE